MAVTIAKYYTPSGRDINKKGIEPDYKLELTEAQMKAMATGNSVKIPNDPQYAKALSVLNQQIASGQKTLLKSVKPSKEKTAVKS
jgi:carboxyl-terminal processing protease